MTRQQTATRADGSADIRADSATRPAVLAEATAGLEPPFAVVDLDAFDTNAGDLTRRAAGRATIRLASKSVRCRALIERATERSGYHGVLGFTLPEALWLAQEHDDVVVAYPTADRQALRRLADDPHLASRITLMIDSVEQLDLIDAAVGAPHATIKVCLDLDASLEAAGGRVHLGPLRSPVRTPAQAAELARKIVARNGFVLDGLMSYEGLIAGLGDNQPGLVVKRAVLRAIQHRSAGELRARRAEVVAAIRDVTPLRFVNGGGTGSIESTSAETAITEIGAGSGLYGPGLFDHYRGFRPLPAAFFVLSVVRRPSARVATALGGGWIASGPTGRDRLPKPAWPQGLSFSKLEGAGEVQTPLLGAGAARLRLGDQVWLRHAKAGELCERVNELYLVQGDRIVDQVPTYRGEGHAFL
jgi:D-serine deaminase-like pyridoxal phosphate-dependent protein